MHAGGLAASAELLVGDIIVEVNEKDPGIEPFASLLPRDETVAIRLRIVRMMEAAAFLALPAPAAATSTVALPSICRRRRCQRCIRWWRSLALQSGR